MVCVAVLLCLCGPGGSMCLCVFTCGFLCGAAWCVFVSLDCVCMFYAFACFACLACDVLCDVARVIRMFACVCSLNLFVGCVHDLWCAVAWLAFVLCCICA